MRGEKMRSIDWFLYHRYILYKQLFPYIQKLHELHPNRPIIVVEDGTSIHTKARGICEAEYTAIGVVRAPHTLNSPDLNQIVPVWDYIRDQLDGRFQRSESHEAMLKGRALITDEWQRVGLKAQQLCNSFRAKCERVIELDGDNKCHG
jgi:transposase